MTQIFKPTLCLPKLLSLVCFLAFSLHTHAQCADTSATGDCDNDGILNNVDTDIDGDGILNENECTDANTVNLALQATATMNTTYTNRIGYSYSAQFVNDNDFISMAHTRNAPKHDGDWIDLDLGSPKNISEIIIYNRETFAGRLSNCWVMVASTAFPNTTDNTVSLAHASHSFQFGTLAEQTNYPVNFGQEVTAQFVRVQRPNNTSNANPLNIMEIQVFNYQSCDTDGDGIFDIHDLDSDNDGCADADEVNSATDPSIIGATCTLLDTDSDGVPDTLDDYPNDANWAFAQHYPAQNSHANLMFEDLWPFIGDYDFNDTAIKYHITQKTDPNNNIVALDFNITLVGNGGGYTNAFAFALEDLTPADIASVSGNQLQGGVFTLSANGTEAGQTHAIIPIFDTDYAIFNQEFTVTVTLANPMASVGNAPFNPFLVVDGTRAFEIHLIGHNPTDLGNATPTVTGDNADVDGNYASNTGLPWAINVVAELPLPLEKTPINEGYVNFNNWAQSGGSSDTDWYLNKHAYRAGGKLQE